MEIKPAMGRASVEFVSALFFLEQQLTIEENLIFAGEEGDSDVFIFKISRPYPGHEEYRGCSRAPILDSDGNIIPLVIGGDITKNEIYGINLNKYKIVLDIESGLIK